MNVIRKSPEGSEITENSTIGTATRMPDGWMVCFGGNATNHSHAVFKGMIEVDYEIVLKKDTQEQRKQELKKRKQEAARKSETAHLFVLTEYTEEKVKLEARAMDLIRKGDKDGQGKAAMRALCDFCSAAFSKEVEIENEKFLVVIVKDGVMRSDVVVCKYGRQTAAEIIPQSPSPLDTMSSSTSLTKRGVDSDTYLKLLKVAAERKESLATEDAEKVRKANVSYYEELEKYPDGVTKVALLKNHTKVDKSGGKTYVGVAKLSKCAIYLNSLHNNLLTIPPPQLVNVPAIIDQIIFLSDGKVLEEFGKVRTEEEIALAQVAVAETPVNGVNAVPPAAPVDQGGGVIVDDDSDDDMDGVEEKNVVQAKRGRGDGDDVEGNEGSGKRIRKPSQRLQDSGIQETDHGNFCMV